MGLALSTSIFTKKCFVVDSFQHKWYNRGRAYGKGTRMEGGARRMAAPRKDDVKSAVLNAAQRLLETGSWDGISLADIAKESGVSKGTLYYHYKTKGEILFELANRYLSEQWDDLIRWAEDKEKDTSLRRLAKYVVERDIASAGLRMRLLCEAQDDEALREKLVRRYGEFERLISEKIAERTDLSADFLTWLLLLVSDGIIVQKAIQDSGFDAEAFIEQGTRYLGQLGLPEQGGKTSGGGQ